MAASMGLTGDSESSHKTEFDAGCHRFKLRVWNNWSSVNIKLFTFHYRTVAPGTSTTLTIIKEEQNEVNKTQRRKLTTTTMQLHPSPNRKRRLLQLHQRVQNLIQHIPYVRKCFFACGTQNMEM
jgi:hypothetical protein